ncbi:MAG: hypothetical protein B6D55_01625 [Candidatus Omnitrophica bacterium 4484_70.2]|nr:MAG: hypothetical protein B6D55_01625 [Candidatus Omnitrophica bacterium 4484_70.2]
MRLFNFLNSSLSKNKRGFICIPCAFTFLISLRVPPKFCLEKDNFKKRGNIYKQGFFNPLKLKPKFLFLSSIFLKIFQNHIIHNEM